MATIQIPPTQIPLQTPLPTTTQPVKILQPGIVNQDDTTQKPKSRRRRRRKTGKKEIAEQRVLNNLIDNGSKQKQKRLFNFLAFILILIVLITVIYIVVENNNDDDNTNTNEEKPRPLSGVGIAAILFIFIFMISTGVLISNLDKPRITKYILFSVFGISGLIVIGLLIASIIESNNKAIRIAFGIMILVIVIVIVSTIVFAIKILGGKGEKSEIFGEKLGATEENIKTAAKNIQKEILPIGEGEKADVTLANV